MNNGAVLFLGILLSLAGSFWALLVAPQLQFGRQPVRGVGRQRRIVSGASSRPGAAGRPGIRGARLRGMSHTPGPPDRRGIRCAHHGCGNNFPAVFASYGELLKPDGEHAATGDDGLDTKHLKNVPASVGSNLTAAAAAQKLINLTRFTARCATAVPVLIALGPDMQRGWGVRLSTAQDYLQDYRFNWANFGWVPISPTTAPARPMRRRSWNGCGTPSGGFQDRRCRPIGIFPARTMEALDSYLISLRANASCLKGP